MSSAVTYIAIANFFGSHPPPTAPVPGPLQIPFQVLASRYNYTYTPGVGAHKVVTAIKTWYEARKFCHDQRGHLAIVNSVAEAEAIARLLRAVNEETGWVGLHDIFEEGEFVTIHDESLAQTGFDTWRAGEPNNVGDNEDCVLLTDRGEMLDLLCTVSKRSICEFHYA